MSIQVKRNLLGRIDDDVFRGVVQQLDGLAFLSRRNCSLKGGVPIGANLGNCRCNAIRAIGVLGASKSVGEITRGNRLVERTN